MKNNLIYLALTAMLLSFNACEENSDEPEISLDPKDAPALLSKSVTQEESDFYNSTSTREYFYDEENKLIKINSSFQTYRDGVVNQDDQDTMYYTYNSEDKVIEMLRVGENWPHKETFTYSGNLITMISSYLGGSDDQLSEKQEITTNNDGNIIKIQRYYYDSFLESFTKNISYDVFEWGDDNLLKVITYNTVEEGDTITNERFMVYNDHISPSAFSSVNTQLNSKNLVNSSSSESADDRFVYTATYSYVFGTNGFPSETTTVSEYIMNVDDGEPQINTWRAVTTNEYIDLN